MSIHAHEFERTSRLIMSFAVTLVGLYTIFTARKRSENKNDKVTIGSLFTKRMINDSSRKRNYLYGGFFIAFGITGIIYLLYFSR
jgi:hypothetical protein